MKIHTLSLVIDDDGNVIHSEYESKSMEKVSDKEDAIESTTLEDMVTMEEIDTEGVARA
tara:strand:- start:580 stop:756 length:177 start_codon:yes stop_codon:yes gene_type:complete